MNAEKLRSLQAPLKARYKEDPSSALVTLHARGRLDPQSLTCVIDSARPGIPVGLHPATGGDGSAACSGDMLLEALVGCAAVTLGAVATAMGIPLNGAALSAEGELDFRGTLGVSKEAPVGFTRIRMLLELDTTAPPAQLQKLLELTERYCVVFQTLAKSASVELSLKS